MKRFSPSVSDNPALNRVQSNLEESLGFLRDKEIISGRLVTVNVPAATTVNIGHGLGQKFKGYFPVKIRKQDGTPRSFDNMVEQQSTDESLYFSLSVLGSDELTVSFWIF